MRKTLLALLTAFCLIALSCEKGFEERGNLKDVTISTIIGTKVTLNASHDRFVWENGDAICLFNDFDKSTLKVAASQTPQSVAVPQNAGKLFGICPWSDHKDGPSSVTVRVPSAQSQTAPGVLNGTYWPVAAKASITDGSASLAFSPLAAAFCFNVFFTEGNASGETITSISVKPLEDNHFSGSANVDLTASICAFSTGDSEASSVSVSVAGSPVISGSKPVSSKDALYFTVLARRVYSRLEIRVTTSKGHYTITTAADATFDLQTKDFVIFNINLTGKTISADDEDVTEHGSGSFQPLSEFTLEEQSKDIIPDFSRVGYKYGDEPIPTLAVKAEITPASVSAALSSGTFKDTTSYIQSVIDGVGQKGGGAILLRQGEYHTHGTLFVDYSNTVLRGEGKTKTILWGDGVIKRPIVFVGKAQSGSAYQTLYDESGKIRNGAVVGTGKPEGTTNFSFAGRRMTSSTLRAAGVKEFGNYYINQYVVSSSGISYLSSSAVAEDYVPVGRLYLEVADSRMFYPGQTIAIYRPHNNDWITDIGMDKIAVNGREVINSGTQQWNTLNFERYWSRKVTAVRGKRIYIDVPIVQALDANYGGGKVFVTKYECITGSGVEDMTIKCSCDLSITYNSRYVDENHAWDAVSMKRLEHGWVRNVDSYHMGYAIVNLGTGCRNITVENCTSHTPVSIVNGGRRYAFNLSGAECCLIKDCISADYDRHAFITNSSKGPNVFLRCSATQFTGSIGPHQHWGTGDLYDNVDASSAGSMECYDRGNAGTGHGWAGANYVYWNCKAKKMTCQSPWSKINTPTLETVTGGYKFHSEHPSARNYCIGFIGQRTEPGGYENPYSDDYGPKGSCPDYYIQLGFTKRPDAEWYPYISVNGSNSQKVTLPDASAAAKYDWWPSFILTSFSHPESIYECQLEDRHARGIYLNTL